MAISGISVTEDNYDVVVALLKDKFGSKESIIETLYARLYHLPTSSGKFNDIKYTYNNVERLLRQLESQGETINRQKMLIYQILSKFPVDVVVKLEDAKKCGVEWTMELLRKLLTEYITIQECAQRRVANAKGRVYTQDGEQVNYRRDDLRNTQRWSTESSKGDRRMFQETSVDTLAANVRRKGCKSLCCVFCKGDHYNDECKKFKTLSERKQRLITQGRCFLCFKVGHTFRDCPLTQRQSCHYCERRGHHNRAICPKRIENEVEDNPKDTAPDNVSAATDDSNNQPLEVINSTTVGSDQVLIASGEKVLLQTAYVPIQTAEGKLIKARVLLDSASHRTFMTEKLAKELKLQSEHKELLSVSTFGAKNPQDVDTYVVHFNVMSKDNSALPLQANVVHKITGPIQRGPLQSSDLDFLLSVSPEKMADTVPKTLEPVNIDLLIGSDYFWNILGTEKVILPSGLYLVSSKIGYILTGKYTDPGHVEQNVSTCFVTSQVNCLVTTVNLFSSENSITKNSSIEDFCRLETIGINDSPDLTDDDVALEQFNNSICFQKGRYYVRWPWKYDYLDLPENLDVALGRMRSLAKRLRRDNELLAKYDDVISNQVKQGIIEKVIVDKKVEGKHYLPHHPVVTPSKSTTKLRIVYDASIKAKKGDKSLNECLYRGPVLLPDLCGILLRFRMQTIVLLADVEKAFLQIGIHELDRDVTRFLWFKDLTNLNVTEKALDVYRFCRVPFGIICSPFLLAGTIKYHLRKINTTVASKICDNIYIDNVLLGAESVQGAYEIYLESKDIFKKASMNLREWISNSSEFLKLLPASEIVKGSIVKTFGIPWHYREDYLQIGGINFTHLENFATKRGVLKLVAKIFDPLGLVTPVTFYGKVFLQELWKQGLQWDEPLLEHLHDEWKEILLKLRPLMTLKIPRFVGNVSKLCELLVFCDASMKAYATALYLRIKTQNSISVNLIFSKMRLVSKSNNKRGLKHITLPRLELLAVTIGVRAANFVVKELKVTPFKQILWTDSTCVVHWLKSSKPLPVFVANRIKEILRASDVSFRYVPSSDNPADLPTRGLSAAEIPKTNLWWYGPSWLKNSEDTWPQWCVPTDTIKESEDNEVFHEMMTVSHKSDSEKNKGCNVCNIDADKYSSLRKLLRITVYCLKFIKQRVWTPLSSLTKKKIGDKYKLILAVMKSLTDSFSVSASDIKIVALLWVNTIILMMFLLLLRRRENTV